MARLTEPFIEFFRYLPAPAFGALAVAVLGIDDAPKVAIIFIGTFFQQVLVIANTTRRIDPALIEAAQTLGASRRAAVHARGRARRHRRPLHRHAHPARLGLDVPDRRRADRRQLRHHLLHQPAGEVPQLRQRLRGDHPHRPHRPGHRPGARVAGAAAVPLAADRPARVVLGAGRRGSRPGAPPPPVPAADAESRRRKRSRAHDRRGAESPRTGARGARALRRGSSSAR